MSRRQAKTGSNGSGVGSGYRWEPTKKTRDQATVLFGCGATQQQVADLFGVSLNAIQNRLKVEYKNGRELADLQLYSALWDKGVKKGDTACLIFLAKNRLGMMDRPPIMPFHPNDLQPPAREELCIEVRYRYAADPSALAPPPPDRLPKTIEAEARPA